MRTPAHSRLRLVLAARIQTWRTASRHSFDRSAQEPTNAVETDARAAALREVADEIEGLLAADTNGGDA